MPSFCLQILKVLRAPAAITRPASESTQSGATEAGNKRKREDADADDAYQDPSDATAQVQVSCQAVPAFLPNLHDGLT